MIFYSMSRFSPVAFVLSIFLAAPPGAAPQSVVSGGKDRISIHAESVSLATFFDELSAIVPVEVLVLSPAVENVSVSLELSEVHPVFGVHKFLEKAEVDYAVSGGDGEPFRILVGALGDANLSAMGRTGSSRASDGAEVATYAEDVEADYDADAGAMESYPEEETFSQEQTGRNRVTGMAGSGLAGGAQGSRSVTGMASPGTSEGALQPAAPGGVVPPPMVPPSPETQDEGAAPRPKSQRPSPVTGGGFVITGSAGLSSGPPHRRVAAAGGVLAIGLSLGLLLVRRVDA